MAALTAASWTVVITEQFIHQKERTVRGTLALAGTDTYPTGGIPLPALGLLGLYRNISKLTVSPLSATVHYPAVYDKVNHKLQLFEEEDTAAGGALLECDTSEVPGARTWNYEAVGW